MLVSGECWVGMKKDNIPQVQDENQELQQARRM